MENLKIPHPINKTKFLCKCPMCNDGIDRYGCNGYMMNDDDFIKHISILKENKLKNEKIENFLKYYNIK